MGPAAPHGPLITETRSVSRVRLGNRLVFFRRNNPFSEIISRGTAVDCRGTSRSPEAISTGGAVDGRGTGRLSKAISTGRTAGDGCETARGVRPIAADGRGTGRLSGAVSTGGAAGDGGEAARGI